MPLKYSQEELNRKLVRAIKESNLAEIKYWLTSPELSCHASIHSESDLLLRSAVYHNYIPLLDYVLHDPDLEEHYSLDLALKYACQYDALAAWRYVSSVSHTVNAYVNFMLACSYESEEIALYLLNQHQCYINVKDGKYSLDWALKMKKDNFIIAMMHRIFALDQEYYALVMPTVLEYCYNKDVLLLAQLPGVNASDASNETVLYL